MKKTFMACLILGIMLVSMPLGAASPQYDWPEVDENQKSKPLTPTSELVWEERDYEIIRQDISYREESSGLPLILIYFDQVTLKGSGAAVKKINDQIEEECRAFLDKYPAEEYEWYLSIPGATTKYYYQNNATAQVMWNQNGLLSIRMTYNWYMGGVFNQDFGGMTFDLRKGKRTTLADLVRMPEKALLEYLREAVIANAPNEVRQWMYGEETLDAYTIEDYDFFIENGEIVVCMPNYELGPGADGPLLVYTGLMV